MRTPADTATNPICGWLPCNHQQRHRGQRRLVLVQAGGPGRTAQDGTEQLSGRAGIDPVGLAAESARIRPTDRITSAGWYP